MLLPPSIPLFPPRKAHASVMPSLPGERGMVLHVPAGDTLGTLLGMGRGEGPCWAPGGVKPKEKSGCAQLWLGHPWLQGRIFVLYFSHVSFPEPGSSVYHPETAIKNKPLAVFFSGLCLHVQSRVRDQLSFPCVASAVLPWVLQWAAAPCPWGRSGSHPLAALRPATAQCRNEPSESSGTQHGSSKRGCSITLSVVQAPAPPAPWAPWLCCGRPGG